MYASIRPQHEDPLTLAIRHCIETPQQALGPRIERIFGSGGGLVAVLDRAYMARPCPRGSWIRTRSAC